jgi:hypothetical protein
VSDITDHVTIREAYQKDLNFILDSSITCLAQYKESIVAGMNRLSAHNHLEIIIKYLLSGIDTSIFICTHKEDTDSIIGYIVADAKTNHIYLQYTKYAFRKLGIQKNLLMPLVVDFDKPITVQWPTKEMLKLYKLGRTCVNNQCLELLIQLAGEYQ